MVSVVYWIVLLPGIVRHGRDGWGLASPRKPTKASIPRSLRSAGAGTGERLITPRALLGTLALHADAVAATTAERIVHSSRIVVFLTTVSS